MPVPLRRIFSVACRSLLSERSLVSRLPHRVRLSYIDLNRHMNYASYLEVMELGRWHWALTSGAARDVFRDGNCPVVVDVNIQYRKELKPLTRFLVDTRLVALEKRLGRFEQHFIVDDWVHAKATVGVLVLQRGKVASATAVTELLGQYCSDRLALRGNRLR